MATITEASLDDRQRSLLRRNDKPAASRPAIHLGPAAPLAAVVLFVVGTAAALGGWSSTTTVAGVVAVAAGGWLVGRGERPDVRTATDLERTARILTIERGEVIRAALAIASISGRDDGPERARRAGLVADAVEPRGDAGDDEPAGRPDLRAIRSAGSSVGETLDPSADAGLLG